MLLPSKPRATSPGAPRAGPSPPSQGIRTMKRAVRLRMRSKAQLACFFGLVTLFVPAAARAQAPLQDIASQPLEEWSVFHGPPGGHGSVARYEVQTGAPLRPSAELEGLRWLPIEIIGREQGHEGNPAFPQVHADLPLGVTRIELPNGLGGLYHFERLRADGSKSFGYLFIPKRGRARVMLELRGLAGTLNPWHPRIALDPQGDSFLAATLEWGSGDLWEVDLRTPRPRLRTAHLGPVRIGLNGMGLGDQFGFAVTSQGVLRVQRSNPGDAEWVPVPGPAVAYWSGEAALSRAGTAAIVLGGDSPTALIPFALTAQGGLQRALDMPQKIGTAGYLPETLGGPYLSISDDGRHLAWTAFFPAHMGGEVRDVMQANLNALAPAAQVTGDANIIDTLEEVGRIGHFGARLFFAVGEANDPTEGGLEAADFFESQLDDQGTLTMFNRTGTMGDNTWPFTTGVPTLVPERVLDLSAGRTLIFDGESEQLFFADLQQGGLQPIHADVKELYWAREIDGWAVVAFGRRSGARPNELWRFSLTQPGVGFPLDSGSPLHVYAPPVRLDGAWLGILTTVVSTQSIRRMQPASGQIEIWNGGANQFTGPLLAGPAGALGFSPAQPNSNQQVLWFGSGQAQLTLQHPSYPGHWLP